MWVTSQVRLKHTACACKNAHTDLFMATCCITLDWQCFHASTSHQKEEEGKSNHIDQRAYRNVHWLRRAASSTAVQHDIDPREIISVRAGWSAAALGVSQWMGGSEADQSVTGLIRLNAVCSIHAASANKPNACCALLSNYLLWT